MRTFLLLSAFWAFSALAVDLPQIQKPQELESGEFAEGTMTSLSPDQIKELLPWANNAKKQLTDALDESKRLPLRERLAFIENEVKSVVRASNPKKYQLLMRYALNRGLLMVDFLDKEANSKEVGIAQNQLEILTSSIQTSFDFYESDIAFQKRATEGKNVIALPQAELGMKISKIFFTAAESVLDASAQYQILKKSFEILNWDLVQDQNAKEYAEAINDIFKTVSVLPRTVKSDEEALKHIRTLNYLKKKIRNLRVVGMRIEPVVEAQQAMIEAIYLDKSTNLFWTRESLGGVRHERAIAACENLKLEGKSWRLPTKEEYEAGEKNKIRESLDFKDRWWWSSSVHADNSDLRWVFYGDSGGTGGGYRDSNFSVRCVSSGASEVAPNQASVTVYPKKIVGLYWTQESLGEMIHEDATSACENLKLEGKTWSLPTKEEYEAAEKNNIRAKLDFKGKRWWSSSVRASYSRYAWVFSGSRGVVGYGYRSNYGSVRCVAR